MFVLNYLIISLIIKNCLLLETGKGQVGATNWARPTRRSQLDAANWAKRQVDARIARRG